MITFKPHKNPLVAEVNIEIKEDSFPTTTYSRKFVQ